MAWKDILVHADDSDGFGARLEIAVHIALANAAHLTGLYHRPEIDPLRYAEPDLVLEGLDKIIAAQRDTEARVQEVFESAARNALLQAEWQAVDHHRLKYLADETHYADLIVAGQATAGKGGPLAEALLLGSGRPTLLIPHIGVSVAQIKRVLVAWNETREAARAVHDALPLLESSDEVHVLCVADNKADVEQANRRSATLCRHLARHGINAESHSDVVLDIEVADAVLSRAADLQVDAIVMGAYGHSKLRELVLGGATRSLLDQMTVPVLMSH